ncbi:MAG: diacylglycerol kinase family protein [Spirochaetia bacterium]|nr:diacylglycerol kinase family protein [Spirochaetia bacterium]
MKEFAILLNPSSGSKRASKNIKNLQNALLKYEISYDLFISKSEDDLKKLTREKSKTHKYLIAAGGDSTFLIMVNELLKRKIPAIVGLIGLGSSDDIVRDYGFLTLDEACATLKNKSIQQIDIGTIKSSGKILSYFIGQANIGLGVSVNRYVENFKKKHKLWGKSQFIGGLLGMYYAYKKHEVPVLLNIKSKDKEIEKKFILTLFTKIKYWATGIKMAPGANSTDGFLQAVFFTKCGFFRLLKLTLMAKKETHLKEKEVINIVSKKYSVSSIKPFSIQIDGEIIKENDKDKLFTNVEIGVLPKAIKMLK